MNFLHLTSRYFMVLRLYYGLESLLNTHTHANEMNQFFRICYTTYLLLLVSIYFVFGPITFYHWTYVNGPNILILDCLRLVYKSHLHSPNQRTKKPNSFFFPHIPSTIIDACSSLVLCDFSCV